MSTHQTPLSAFFSSYTFNRYTYDPSRDPADEFERLCIARQWGGAMINKNLQKCISAVEETRNQPVAIFFRKYEFMQFTHNLWADPVAEFDRLQTARKWGEKKLKGITDEFLAALEGKTEAAEPAGTIVMETRPIVEFLKGQEVSGYTYCSGRPEEEFRGLVKAHRRIWEAEERRMGRKVGTRKSMKRWRKSTEFIELQEGFCEAVEGQFDLTLDKIAGRTGMRRDEVMVELYGVGKAPLSKEEAETALEAVHVNIYDFLEVVDTTISAASDYEKQNLIRLLSPGARALNFPDDAMLAIYSVCMGRVFPRDLAESDGTLILLLRLIRRYFGPFDRVLENFKIEAGEDLDMAKEQGPDAVRELLLSREWESLQGVRAIPGKTFASLRRARG